MSVSVSVILHEKVVFFNTMPYLFYEEMIFSHSLTGGILHLSIGDGAAAIEAIEHGIKCFGVTLSDVHTELLYKKLADEVFMRMLDGRFT